MLNILLVKNYFDIIKFILIKYILLNIIHITIYNTHTFLVIKYGLSLYLMF